MSIVAQGLLPLTQLLIQTRRSSFPETFIQLPVQALPVHPCFCIIKNLPWSRTLFPSGRMAIGIRTSHTLARRPIGVFPCKSLTADCHAYEATQSPGRSKRHRAICSVLLCCPRQIPMQVGWFRSLWHLSTLWDPSFPEWLSRYIVFQ